MFPYGTSEQYPNMVDAQGNVLTNTGHEYRECSNKGICDRTTGTCACFEGYDGSACQRASCPTSEAGVCSGHGTCETIKEISARDFNNIYQLWDEEKTMGCVCDGGYTGADCSQKVCKFGTDPLYFDESATKRYSNYTYLFYSKDMSATLTGNYSIVFYDAVGEDWETVPIAWNSSCSTVIEALEGLPNNVIAYDSIRCYKSSDNEGGPTPDANRNIYSQYTIAFPMNPGKLPQIEINKYLDGSRPTLFTDETVSTLTWNIFPNGFIGEHVDMVPDLCEGVFVQLNQASPTQYLSGLDAQTTKALKRCLGTSDNDDSNNVDVYNWDYGNIYNPHLIKLVDATQSFSDNVVTVDGGIYDPALRNYPITQLCTSEAGNPQKFGTDGYGIGYCNNENPAGFFAVLYYDESETFPFRIYTRAANDYDSTTKFRIYTTTGYLQIVSYDSAAFSQTFGMSDSVKADKHYQSVLHFTNYTDSYLNYDGGVDCETRTVGSNGLMACLSKDDYIMLLSTSVAQTATQQAANPIYPNIYQVKKISKLNPTATTDPNMARDLNILQLDYSLNADFMFNGGNSSSADTSAHVYKFFPPATATMGYEYVAECSNRGICDTDSGLCDCFPGYTSDDCSVINALAL